VARKKGDKDYTKSEKQIIISLISGYSRFGEHDYEIIQMQKRKDSEEWLDYYSKYQFVDAL
jgi:hypothetical protein